MNAKIELSPEQIAKARHLYEQTLVPVVQIAASLGVSDSWLYSLIKNQNWRRRHSKSGDFHFARFLSEAEALAPRHEPGVHAPILLDQAAIDGARLQLAFRLQGAAERLLDAATRVVAILSPADQAEAERSARVVALIAHAIREVAELNKPSEAPQPHESEDDDPVPRDLDQFRIELARRIQTFIDSRQSVPGARPEVADLPQIADRPLE